MHATNAKNVKNSRDDCLEVAHLVYQITDGILDATAGMKEDGMTERLIQDLKVFQSKLERISINLRLQFNRGFIPRLFRQQEMAGCIAKSKAELTIQISIFQATDRRP